MRMKLFLKAFGVGVGAQIVLLVSSRFVTGLGEFLLTYLYWHWIKIAIGLSGARGEAAMIWPPVFGLIGGVLIYSLIAALLFLAFKVGRKTA